GNRVRLEPVRIAKTGTHTGDVENILQAEGRAGQRPMRGARQLDVVVAAEGVELVAIEDGHACRFLASKARPSHYHARHPVQQDPPRMSSATAWKPERQIEIIAGTPPGGGVDRSARALLKAIEANGLLDGLAKVVNIGGDGGRKAWVHIGERA